MFFYLVLLVFFPFLWYAGNAHAVSLKVPSFFSEVYEEPLMFCLNEEDEEDEPSQSDSGKIFFQSNFTFLEVRF